MTRRSAIHRFTDIRCVCVFVERYSSYLTLISLTETFALEEKRNGAIFEVTVVLLKSYVVWDVNPC